MQNELGYCKGSNHVPIKGGKMVFIVNRTHYLCNICNKERLDSQKDKKIAPINKDKGMTDDIWYKLAWDLKKVKQCEECNTVLRTFSRSYISHILSKGAFPSLRHNLDNYSLLCFQCHQTYEFGNRKSMNIYPKIEKIIIKLKAMLLNKNVSLRS